MHFWLFEYMPVGHTVTHCEVMTRHLWLKSVLVVLLLRYVPAPRAVYVVQPVYGLAVVVGTKRPMHLLLTPAGKGHDSSFLMGLKNRLHVVIALKFIAGRGPTR